MTWLTEKQQKNLIADIVVPDWGSEQSTKSRDWEWAGDPLPLLILF